MATPARSIDQLDFHWLGDDWVDDDTGIVGGEATETGSSNSGGFRYEPLPESPPSAADDAGMAFVPASLKKDAPTVSEPIATASANDAGDAAEETTKEHQMGEQYNVRVSMLFRGICVRRCV